MSWASARNQKGTYFSDHYNVSDLRSSAASVRVDGSYLEECALTLIYIFNSIYKIMQTSTKYIGSHTRREILWQYHCVKASRKSFVITSWGRGKNARDYSSHALLHVHNFLCNILSNSGQFQYPLSVKHNWQNLRLLSVLLGLVELYPRQDFDNPAKVDKLTESQTLIVKVVRV